MDRTGEVWAVWCQKISVAMSGRKGRLASIRSISGEQQPTESTDGSTSIISTQKSKSQSPNISPNNKKSSSLHQIQLPKIESSKVHRSSDVSKDTKAILHPLIPLSEISPSKGDMQGSNLTPIPNPSTIRLEPLLIHSPVSLPHEISNVDTPPVQPNVPPPSIEISEKVIDYSMENGEVTILYEMYDEKFPITAGTISNDTINELYGLDDIMPHCSLHLSKYSPTQIREMIIASSSTISTLPLGSLGFPEWYCPYDSMFKLHRELQVNEKYYCYVQEEKQENVKREQPNHVERIIEQDDGRGFDCCTCIYGTPCQVGTIISSIE